MASGWEDWVVTDSDASHPVGRVRAPYFSGDNQPLVMDGGLNGALMLQRVGEWEAARRGGRRWQWFRARGGPTNRRYRSPARRFAGSRRAARVGPDGVATPRTTHTPAARGLRAGRSVRVPRDGTRRLSVPRSTESRRRVANRLSKGVCWRWASAQNSTAAATISSRWGCGLSPVPCRPSARNGRRTPRESDLPWTTRAVHVADGIGPALVWTRIPVCV